MTPEYDEETPEPNELIDTISVLLPLRQRKLARLKRVLMAEKARLKEMEADLKRGQNQLLLFRQAYQETTNAFTTYHTGVLMLHEKLHQTLEAEKATRGRLLKQDEENQTLITQISSQTDTIHEAQHAVEICQREIEKLEYILEEKELM